MCIRDRDIDTGDSPSVSSRPYTLALKHHKWVQEEIEMLERAGVIAKSMSPRASPIVVVAEKSQSGEPPKKRLCIDFRKINDLQQKVITEGLVAYPSSHSPRLMKCMQN